MLVEKEECVRRSSSHEKQTSKTKAKHEHRQWRPDKWGRHRWRDRSTATRTQKKVVRWWVWTARGRWSEWRWWACEEKTKERWWRASIEKINCAEEWGGKNHQTNRKRWSWSATSMYFLIWTRNIILSRVASILMPSDRKNEDRTKKSWNSSRKQSCWPRRVRLKRSTKSHSQRWWSSKKSAKRLLPRRPNILSIVYDLLMLLYIVP